MSAPSMAAAPALVDLRRESSWDPASLTAEAFEWPTQAPLAPLREVVTSLAARSFADAGAPVITPMSLDATTGAVRRRSRKYQGSVFQVGAELHTGDVLIPRSGTGPTLLVSERLAGALVSARFTALRPLEPDLGLWLWAVFGSESGSRLRVSLSQGGTLTNLNTAALLDSQVPMPMLADRYRVSEQLWDLERATHVEEEASGTWWHVADLRATPWQVALATPDRSLLDDGTPLEMLYGQIARGRNTRDSALLEPALGYLPVSDVSVLGGKPPRRWLPADHRSAVVASPGDVLVALVGNYAYATVATEQSVADQHVVVLRFRDHSHATPIAAYLNSQRGYRVRQMLLSGSAIQSLRPSDLASLRIPDAALYEATQPEVAPAPIARRLENLLWGH